MTRRERRVYVLWTLVAALVSPGLSAAQRGDSGGPGNLPTSRTIEGPPVRLDPSVVDFGDVRPMSEHTKAVTIVNESDRPVMVKATRTNCGCTLASFEPTEIEAGGSVTFDITFRAGRLDGEVGRYVTVLFEGYLKPLRVPTRANVNEGIRVRRVYEPIGQTETGVIHLEGADGVPFRVLSIGGRETEPGGLREAALEHRIEFDVASLGAEAAARDWLAIETDHPEAAVLAVRIERWEEPAIRRAPPRWGFAVEKLVLGRVEPGEGLVIEVPTRGWGLSRRDAGSVIQSVSIDGVPVRVELLEAKINETSDEVAVLRLTPEASARGLLHGVLKLRAFDSEQSIEVMARAVPGSSRRDLR